MAKWIPVEERLPDDTRDVLITIIDHECDDDLFVEYGYFDPEVNEWYSYSYSALWDDETKIDVVAWMEHPEPYRKEQTNE